MGYICPIQALPCIHIHGCHIYIFSLHLDVNMLLLLACIYLCMLQAYHPTSLLPPTKRVALDSMQQNRPKCHGTKWIRPCNMT